MPRFVDYFAIIGINYEQLGNVKEGGELVPCVLHMTPQTEWEDFCFPPGLTKFCFPGGYEPVSECPRPTFFSDVLTDIDGNRCHCAIILFYERADPGRSIFVPKALTIVSQYAYISNYKDILAAIFENLRNGSINRNSCNAENFIFQIIYNQYSPEAGSPKFSISLGSNTSTVYPPISPTIPATDDYVATLFELVGIDKLIKLFGALLNDNRIVFLSKSYTYLDKCTHALTSLVYPIKYKFVYIPILPKDLIDYIGAPSPLIVGVQSLCDLNLSDLDHVLIMNLDTGLLIHENLCSPLIPQAYSTQIQKLLVKIALPQISVIDQVYYTRMNVDRRILDKRVRACFFYLFMKLMAGYRPCITYARLVPTPVVRFHPDLFMNHHGTNDAFYLKFFQTTTFDIFVEERGPSYRFSDYFDEIINEFSYKQNQSEDSAIKLIHKISDHFYKNEPSCDPKNPVEIMDFALSWHRIDFQNLKIVHPDSSKIIAPDPNSTINVPSHRCLMSKVPIDISLFQHEMVFYIPYRRRETILECVSLLFKGKISETYKLVDTVIHSVSSKACQFCFINEVISKSDNERTHLTHAQVSILARIFNAILSVDKGRNCYCAAAQILKIACNICHTLAQKYQFLYTYLQQHEIWRDSNFWSNYYFIEIQSCLLNIYRKRYPLFTPPSTRKLSVDEKNHVTIFHPELLNTTDMLEISALIISEFPSLSSEDKLAVEATENAYLHTHTIQILLHASYMLVEFDTIKKYFEEKGQTSDAFRAYKVDIIEKLSNFTFKFLTSANKLVGLKHQQLVMLEELIKNNFESQLDEIESICRSKIESLPLELASKFKPVFIYENESEQSSIMVYALYDKQISEFDYDQLGSLSLFPAQGLLYITNKRVMFLGQSIDPFLSDSPVYISIPIKSILKFKVIEASSPFLSDKLKYSHVIQFKTKTCFGIQFIIDKSVNNEKIESFKKSYKTSVSDISKAYQQQHSTKNLASESYRSGDLNLPKVKEDKTSPIMPDKTISKGWKFNALIKKADMIKTGISFQTFKKPLKASNVIGDYASVSFSDVDYACNSSILNEFYRMKVVHDNPKIQSVWRVTKANKNHRYSLNIPEYSIVPKFFSEESFEPIVKLFRHRRLPLCTFVSGAYPEVLIPTKMIALFRSEAPLKNNLLLNVENTSISSKPSDKFIMLLKSITFTLLVRYQQYFDNKFSFHKIFEMISNPLNVSMISAEINLWVPSLLYIFYDRNYTRDSGIEDISTVPIYVLSCQQIKKSYQDFRIAFFPSNPKDKVIKSFLEIINQSKWPYNVCKALSLASSAIFLADVCMSSSLFSLTDGTELTAILTCLSQISLDPYYRTFIGFQRLIEKEWLEFAYNFYGKNHVDFSPIFIFFLDCVYQMTVQFPWAFEFNTYYLSFIGFHNFTEKFDTFLFGSETVAEDVEDGGESLATIDDSRSDTKSLYSHSTCFDSYSVNQFSDIFNSSNSIFKYIQAYTECCTVFHNMQYDPNFKSVLYPQSYVCCYEVWPLFYVHNFQQYCTYDLETLHPGTMNKMNFDSTGIKGGSPFGCKHSFVNENMDRSYDNLTYSYVGEGTPFVNDDISWTLYEIDRLSDQLDRPISILKSNILDTKETHFSNEPIQSHSRVLEFLYFRSICYRTVETRKTNKIEVDKSDLNLHHLSKSTSLAPSFCVFCSQYIYSNEDTYCCHKCGGFMHISCQIYSDMRCSSSSQVTENTSIGSTSSLVSSMLNDENQIRGKLFTRKLLKNSWVQKYYSFHKKSLTLNIFDASDFSGIPRHSYSVSQLSSCRLLKNQPSNAPKEFIHSGGFFELKIKKKTEIYIAPTKSEATAWVDVISKFINTL